MASIGAAKKKKKGIKSMKKSRVRLSRKQNVQTFKKGAKVKIKNVPKTSRGGIML